MNLANSCFSRNRQYMHRTGYFVHVHTGCFWKTRIFWIVQRSIYWLYVLVEGSTEQYSSIVHAVVELCCMCDNWVHTCTYIAMNNCYYYIPRHIRCVSDMYLYKHEKAKSLDMHDVRNWTHDLLDTNQLVIPLLYQREVLGDKNGSVRYVYSM